MAMTNKMKKTVAGTSVRTAGKKKATVTVKKITASKAILKATLDNTQKDIAENLKKEDGCDDRKSIKLHHITKIEGHANLTIKTDGKKIEKLQLEVIEGARLFEAIVLGRKAEEAPHLTSRICGICSASHHLASLMAVERALGVQVSRQTMLLRELLNIGEMLESHALHIYLLALPDYVGCSSAIEAAKKHKKEVLMGLGLKKLGNTILRTIGGRQTHPLTLKIGGFSVLPDDEELVMLRKELEAARPMAKKTIDLFTSLPYPKFDRYTEYISLGGMPEYPNISGSLVSTDHLLVDQDEYLEFLKEEVISYSTAKFSTSRGSSYYVGALARINNNLTKLSGGTLEMIRKHDLRFPNYSPFFNNVAQALEILHFIDRGIEIIKELGKLVREVSYEPTKKQGRGIAIIEAPRGILIHDYIIGSDGLIKKANIVTPTAQSLKNIEDDLWKFVPGLLKKDKKEAVLDIEKLIRSYDPCISCSTHFLDVKWE